MNTLGAGRILIKSIIIVCLLNLMAWKASWAHRTGENEKKDNDKIKKSRSKRRAPVIRHRCSSLKADIFRVNIINNPSCSCGSPFECAEHYFSNVCFMINKEMFYFKI